MVSVLRFFAVLLVALTSAAPVFAQYRSASDVVDVRLLPGYRLENGRHMAAIRIDLEPGWKTYWRSPGEGGVPTHLSLSQVDGVTGMAIHWPRPEVFVANGLRSIGYRGSVILPVEFAVSTSGSAQVSGRLDFGVCRDVCMPISIDLAATLPAISTRDGSIVAALSDRPYRASEVGAGSVSCSVEPVSDGLRITMRAAVPPGGNDETLVLEHRDPRVWISHAQTRRDGDYLTAIADLVPEARSGFALNRSDLQVTMIGSQLSVDLGACRG